MRKYLFVFGAILAYLLFCSKSCDSSQQDDSGLQEAELLKTRDSIINEFESDYLSKNTLRAFEVKAKEKLADFADYLNIYLCKSMDDTLKSQTGKMIADLFISENTQFKIRTSKMNHEKSLTIKALLSSDFIFDNDSVHFRFDSIEVENHLRKIEKSAYTGTLKFYQTIMDYPSQDSCRIMTLNKKAEMFVVKVNKPFGTDTLQIWRVLLGKIE